MCRKTAFGCESKSSWATSLRLPMRCWHNTPNQLKPFGQPGRALGRVFSPTFVNNSIDGEAVRSRTADA